MQDDYFNKLSIYGRLSFLFLVATPASSYLGISLPPLVAVLALLAPMVPLALYHRYLHSRARSGLSPAAIDSVYYFGFLITVAALGLSALSIWLNGATESLSTIILQFGAGLLATGYAVYARMQLTAASAPLEDDGAEAAKKSSEMVDHVKEASKRLVELSDTMMRMTSEASEAARQATEKAVLEVAHTSREELKSMFSTARDGVNEIRGLVGDPTFAAERQQMTQGLKDTVAAINSLNQAFADLQSRTREGAQATQQSALHATNLERALVQMSARVQELADPEAGLATAAQQLGQVCTSMTQAQAQTRQVVQAMSGIAQNVETAGPAFESMANVSKRVHDELDVLSGVADRMSAALSSMESTTANVEKLATEFGRVAEFMPAVVQSTESLHERFVKAATAAQTLEGSLASLPQITVPLSGLADTVAQSLKTVSEQVAVTAQHAKELDQGTMGVDKAAAAASRLVEAVDRLGDTTQTLQSQLQQFSDKTGSAQRALEETTTGFKAVAQSTESLQDRFARASAAAQTLEVSLASLPQVAAPFSGLADTVAQSLKTVSEQIAVTAQHAKELDQGTQGVEKATAAAGRFADAVDRLGSTTQTLQSNLHEFSNSTGSAQRTLDETAIGIKAVAQSTESLQDRFAKASAAAQTLEASLASLPQVAIPFGGLADTVAQSLKTVSEQVAVAARHARELDQGATGLEKATAAAGRFVEVVDRLGNTTQTLQSQLQQFSDKTGTAQRVLDEATSGIRTAIKQSADALEADVQRSSTASKMLTDSLVDVAKTIVAQTNTRQGIAA